MTMNVANTAKDTSSDAEAGTKAVKDAMDKTHLILRVVQGKGDVVTKHDNIKSILEVVQSMTKHDNIKSILKAVCTV